MATVIKTTFKFKRGLAENWTIKNPILETGEPGFELDTGKLKIGNGITPWNELLYINSKGAILNGYYQNDNFYKDAEYTILLDKNLDTLYIEINTNTLYYFNGINYVLLGGQTPIATEDTPGIMKIYNTIGENTDGAITQKAITDYIQKNTSLVTLKNWTSSDVTQI